MNCQTFPQILASEVRATTTMDSGLETQVLAG